MGDNWKALCLGHWYVQPSHYCRFAHSLADIRAVSPVGTAPPPRQASSTPHGDSDGLQEEPEAGLRPYSGISGLCQLNPFSRRLKGRVTPSRNTVEGWEFLRLLWRVLSRNRKALGVAGPWGLTLNLRTGLPSRARRGAVLGWRCSCVSPQWEQTESSTPGPGVARC